MTIDLVTGASGLVGGNLVRGLIQRGRNVRILVRKNSQTAHLDDLDHLQRIEGDITNVESLRNAFENVGDVYHCAARVTMGRRMNDQMWQANVTGTGNVLQVALERGIHRLVYCSSVDAIGLPEGQRPSDEDSPWNWDRLGVETAYSRTKYTAHQRVLAAAGTGLDAVIVCPTYMFGAYDTHPSSGKMILEVARRRPPFAPPGGNNFINVDDVVEGLIAAAARGRRAQVYILGNANLTYQEILSIIARQLKITPPRFLMPLPLARLAGWMGDLVETISGKEVSINSATVRLSTLFHYYDPSKAIRDLGLPQTPVEVGVSKAIDWFRKARYL